MALARVNSGSFDSASFNNAGGTVSYNLNASTDALVAFLHGERSGDATEPLVDSITYGSNAPSGLVDSAYVIESPNAIKTFAYIWLTAALPSAGSNNFVVSMNPQWAPGGGENGMALTVIEYSGAKQTVPTNTLPVEQTTDGVTVSGNLTVGAATSFVPAAATHNLSPGNWTSHSGTLLGSVLAANSAAGFGDNTGLSGSSAISFTKDTGNFSRAAMVAFELEQAAAGTPNPWYYYAQQQ